MSSLNGPSSKSPLPTPDQQQDQHYGIKLHKALTNGEMDHHYPQPHRGPYPDGLYSSNQPPESSKKPASSSASSATRVTGIVETATAASSTSIAAAADLIREIDHACSEMNTITIKGAEDADEARRNARHAYELARKFRSGNDTNGSPLPALPPPAARRARPPSALLHSNIDSTASATNDSANNYTKMTRLRSEPPPPLEPDQQRHQQNHPAPASPLTDASYPAMNTPPQNQSQVSPPSYILRSSSSSQAQQAQPFSFGAANHSAPPSRYDSKSNTNNNYRPLAQAQMNGTATTSSHPYSYPPPPDSSTAEAQHDRQTAPHHSQEQQQQQQHPPPTQPPASMARKVRKPPSTAERLAQAHAEDVLSLSLELERKKQTLEYEQKAHVETKSALTQMKTKNTQLESQIEKLLNDMETQREQYGRQVDLLEDDLSRAQTRVQAAEEDAQLALDLAKGNAESREQLEGWLQRALHEIQVLREHVITMGSVSQQQQQQQQQYQQLHPKRSNRVVRFAESPTIFTDPPSPQDDAAVIAPPPPSPPPLPPPASRPTRAQVAVGRKILQRVLASSSSSPTSSHRTAQQQEPNADHPVVVLPRKPISPLASAERRRRLRDRLEDSMGGVNASYASPSVRQRSFGSPVASSSTTTSTLRSSSRSPSPRRGTSGSGTNVHELGAAVEALDVCRHTVQILKESGRRLGLSGRWWTVAASRGVITTTNTTGSSTAEEEIHLEQLARHFCNAVEVLLERKQKDIAELEALCSLWEQGTTGGGQSMV